jgi:hypothetical protein
MNSIGQLSEVGNVEIAAAILTDTPIEFKISDENIFEYEIVFVFYPMRVLTVGYVKNAIILSNPCLVIQGSERLLAVIAIQSEAKR